MAKIKLIQALGSKGGGGAESFFTHLAGAFQKEVDQKLLVRPNKAREIFYKENSIPYKRAPFGNPLLDIKTRLNYKKLIRDFQPDIIMTWMSRATILCPKAKGKNFLHVARLGGYYDLKYYKNCDYLVGNTPMIVNYLIKQGWPKERAYYIPNFALENKKKPYTRKALSLKTQEPIFLAVGRLHTNKGFDVLIKAMKNIPEGHLFIAGEGPLRHELEVLSSSLNLKNRITFLGWREDIQELMVTANIFICPSRHEPLGNVVLEAWAGKTPVIASKSHGPSMLIKHDSSGFLFDIDNVDDLTKHMNLLIKDDKKSKDFVKEGLKTFEKYFSKKVVTKQYINFYKNILR